MPSLRPRGLFYDGGFFNNGTIPYLPEYQRREWWVGMVIGNPKEPESLEYLSDRYEGILKEFKNICHWTNQCAAVA